MCACYNARTEDSNGHTTNEELLDEMRLPSFSLMHVMGRIRKELETDSVYENRLSGLCTKRVSGMSFSSPEI